VLIVVKKFLKMIPSKAIKFSDKVKCVKGGAVLKKGLSREESNVRLQGIKQRVRDWTKNLKGCVEKGQTNSKYLSRGARTLRAGAQNHQQKRLLLPESEKTVLNSGGKVVGGTWKG